MLKKIISVAAGAIALLSAPTMAVASPLGGLYFAQGGTTNLAVDTCWWGQGCYRDRQSPSTTNAGSLTTTFNVSTVFTGFTLANTSGIDLKYNFYNGSLLIDTLQVRNWTTSDTCNGIQTCTTANSLVGIFSAYNGGNAISALSGGTDIDVTPLLTTDVNGVQSYSWQAGRDNSGNGNGVVSATYSTGSAANMSLFVVGTLDARNVPEPASLALVGVALAGLGLARKRKV